MGTAAEVELVRQQYASLIGADADDVALTPSTGFAITLAAYNVGRSAGVRRGMTVLVLAGTVRSVLFLETRKRAIFRKKKNTRYVLFLSLLIAGHCLC